MAKPIFLDPDVLVDFFRGYGKAAAFVNTYHDRIILSSDVKRPQTSLPKNRRPTSALTLIQKAGAFGPGYLHR